MDNEMSIDDGYDFMSDDPSDSDEAKSDWDSDCDDMPMTRSKAKIYK